MADCEKAVPSVSRADDGKEEDEEHEHVPERRRRRSGYYKQVLLLAYQSYGVVYGDLSTSPLYVYNSTFTGALRRHQDEDAIFGVFSLIFWTLTLIPLLKYVIVVLSADDDGEGGTLALYSLLIRHAKFSLLPNRQAADEELSTYYKPGYVAEDSRRSSALKQFLEKHEKSGTFLLLMVLFGASLLIGDGVLTPAISVLSSFSGLQLRAKGLKDGDVVLLACVVLVCLFAVQHWGTQRVGFLFAPVVIVWLLAMGAIGFYNVVAWNPRVLRALSPHYVLRFFRRTHTDGWIALGGVMLSMTGTEAMFADLGHFTAASIRVAFVGLIYPCLVLQYMGQAAFLSKCNCDIHLVFFESIPEPVFWPVLVVAMLAAIVGSQAVISATFSIVKQCTALGCFPRVKVVHTSRRIYGQVYIPEINWMLMVLCLAVTVGFRDTALIGNAYGLACAGVMVVTTLLMALVIVFVWQMSSVLAVAFLLVFGSVEAAYASAAVMKVPQGGWLPLALSLVVVAVMYVWHYGTRRKYMFDVENRVSMKWIHALGPSLGIVRVPGIGLVYTELAHGVPAVFSHFVTNLPAFHQVLVFVCVKAVPVPRVRAAERCLVGRVGPRKHRMYRCVIRYGYKDAPRGDDNFENDLVLRVAEFIEMEAPEAASAPASASGRCSAASSADGRMAVVTRPGLGLVVQEADEAYTTLHATGASSPEVAVQPLQTLYEAESPGLATQRRVRFVLADNVAVSAKRAADPLVKEELAALVEAKHAGVAYIMGQSQIKARRTSSVVNKLAIDVVYNFLRRNSRGPAVALNIPHINLIQVGMVYYV